MNRDALKWTAITVFDPQEKVYIAKSTIADLVIGVGDTPEEAREIFEDLIDEAYIAYLEGKRVGPYQKRQTARRGRPPKNTVDIHTQVHPDTKKEIRSFSQQAGCSIGEVIDYMVAYWKSQKITEGTHPGQGS